MPSTDRIIAIGASSGGRAAIVKILSQLPEDFPAAIFVTVHSSFDTPSQFDKLLSRKTKLKVTRAENNMSIEMGTIYVAQPNLHMVIKKNGISLSRGPRENLFRPAIDVMFRSAAVSYANRCIGILLTGRLNDGTSGLEAIEKCGGITIIQNPKTAEYSEMPGFAQENVGIDYILDIGDITEKLLNILERPLPPEVEIPEYLRKENDIINKIGSRIKLEDHLGHKVAISCPSCSGPLWELENSAVKRYRCHVGHSFTEEALLKGQNLELEEVLWVALRTLEEKKSLLERMTQNYSISNSQVLERSYKDKIGEVSNHITKLRSILNIDD